MKFFRRNNAEVLSIKTFIINFIHISPDVSAKTRPITVHTRKWRLIKWIQSLYYKFHNETFSEEPKKSYKKLKIKTIEIEIGFSDSILLLL